MAEDRILVTGGAGFIGSHFIRYLLPFLKGNIVNIDNLTYAGNKDNLKDITNEEKYLFIKGNICDEGLVNQIFKEMKINKVVNFAAESHVDRSIDSPQIFVETNIRGTQVLLEAARRFRSDLFLQISTDEVYGSLEQGFSCEGDLLAPSSPYAASKAAADLLALAYWKTFSLPIVITRSTNNYGPNQYPEKLIPRLIIRGLTGGNLPIYGRGENIRDWLYVLDNVKALVKVFQGGKVGKIYHIGSGQSLGNNEVAEMILEIMDLEKDRLEYVEERPGHDRRYALNCCKIAEELSWQPELEFRRGLENTVNWYRNNREWWQPLWSPES